VIKIAKRDTVSDCMGKTFIQTCI